MSQGYVIVANNTVDTDYQQCARVLEKSLRAVGDTRPVAILQLESTDKYGPYYSDWQVYRQSPWDETFKIEADVIVTRSLEGWWTLCEGRDLLLATGCRDYRQNISTSRYYRRFNDENLLPDVYNGITYFKKSRLAKEFYMLVKIIFERWNEFNLELRWPSPLPWGDTDSVYAMAASIIGVERCTVPNDIIGWVHMKQRINGTTSEDWTQELPWELVGEDFRINTLSQLYPVHYHVKSLAGQLEPIYDAYLQTVL